MATSGTACTIDIQFPECFFFFFFFLNDLFNYCKQYLQYKLYIIYNTNHSVLTILNCTTYKGQFTIGHFTVVCSVTWPLNGSEAGGDLALIQTSPLYHVNANYLALEQLDLQNKSSEVCIKTRSPPASLPFKGQDTLSRQL